MEKVILQQTKLLLRTMRIELALELGWKPYKAECYQNKRVQNYIKSRNFPTYFK